MNNSSIPTAIIASKLLSF